MIDMKLVKAVIRGLSIKTSKATVTCDLCTVNVILDKEDLRVEDIKNDIVNGFDKAHISYDDVSISIENTLYSNEEKIVLSINVMDVLVMGINFKSAKVYTTVTKEQFVKFINDVETIDFTNSLKLIDSIL